MKRQRPSQFILRRPLYARNLFHKKPAPEFEAWLQKMNLTDKYGHMLPVDKTHQLLSIENMEVTYG